MEENTLLTRDDLPMGCDEVRARWRCCACKRDCTLVDDPAWPAFQRSKCCMAVPYRMDPLPTCSECGDEFDDEAGEGFVDAEGTAMCEHCERERTSYELRHAHPEPPVTVAEYLRVKGAA